jgi:DNA polymerase-3 subunit gamma/tau
MVDLADKYRPRQFGDLVGQPRLVAWMKNQVRSRERRSVLITGPIGTGKTSAGLIYAKAILCSCPDDQGEPCGNCDPCRDFGSRGERLPDVTMFKCGETSTVEKIQELLDIARGAPFIADRRVLLLDEAHNLSRRSFQALLDIAENPPPWAAFILITSEKNDLPASLLSRLPCQELELVKQPDALRFMAGICEQETIEFEVAGLELIFAAAGGHPRKLLRALEQVRGFGAVTAIAVRSALHLDFDERLIGYATALLGGDLGRQLELIEDWPETPVRKLEVLHQFLTFIYLTDVRCLERDDPLMRTLPGQVRKQLVDGFATASDRLGLDPVVFWQDSIAVLAPKNHLTTSQLAMIISGFDRLIGRSATTSDHAAVAAARAPRSRRLRVQSGHDSGVEGQSPRKQPGGQISRNQQAAGNRLGEAAQPEQGARLERGFGAYSVLERDRPIRTNGTLRTYLTWPQVRPLWEIGSFLPQQFGLLFNLRLTLRHRALGIAGHRDGAHLVSKLTDDLGARIEYWDPGASYHWVYRHETDIMGGLVSRILLSVPDRDILSAIDWLHRFTARRAKAAITDLSDLRGGTDLGDHEISVTSDRALLISYRRAGADANLKRFHWQGIRSLSRCLDPDFVERDENGAKRSLVDLLHIPSRWRGSVGLVTTAQGMGASKQLTRNARKVVSHREMAPLSALRDRAWSHVDAGWELDEHCARLQEITRRQNATAQIHLRFPDNGELSTARREEELRILRSTFNRDPKSWLRPWVGWWQTPDVKAKT